MPSLNQNPVLSKIDRLREKLYGTDRDDHLDEIAQWEKDAKRAILLENLQEHDGLKMIIEKIKEEIQTLNNRLMTESSETLPQVNRDAIIDVRDYMEWFLSLFTASKSELEGLNKELDDQLAEE